MDETRLHCNEKYLYQHYSSITFAQYPSDCGYYQHFCFFFSCNQNELQDECILIVRILSDQV